MVWCRIVLGLVAIFGMPTLGEAAYCQAWVAVPGANDNPMSAVTEKCQPGDIISLSSQSPVAIGQLCDFTKAITPIFHGGRVMCVMNRPRDIR